jgi:hypothetical protein
MKIDENLREIIEKLDRLNQELLRKIEELSAMAKGRDDE